MSFPWCEQEFYFLEVESQPILPKFITDTINNTIEARESTHFEGNDDRRVITEQPRKQRVGVYRVDWDLHRATDVLNGCGHSYGEAYCRFRRSLSDAAIVTHEGPATVRISNFIKDLIVYNTEHSNPPKPVRELRNRIKHLLTVKSIESFANIQKED